MDILERNFLQKRGKRAIAIMTAIGGLGITNLGLHADLRNAVNTPQHELEKLDTLQDTTNDIQDSLTNIVNELEQLDSEKKIVRASLDIFMILDQIHAKTIELVNEIKQLIHDLVTANTGSVSSTL